MLPVNNCNMVLGDKCARERIMFSPLLPICTFTPKEMLETLLDFLVQNKYWTTLLLTLNILGNIIPQNIVLLLFIVIY